MNTGLLHIFLTLVTVIVFCSHFSIPLHRLSRQKTEQKNRGSLTCALLNRDDRGWTAKYGIVIGVAGRVGIIRESAVSPIEAKIGSEADRQNQVKTRNVRHKNDPVAMLVGHHLVGLALTSSQIVAVGEVEVLAVLTEEGVDRVGIECYNARRENVYVFLNLDSSSADWF